MGRKDTAAVANVHVATAKLLTSDWPLEETGLTAPPTLHCPISSRSIARPSIIHSHSNLPPCYFRYYSRVHGRALSSKKLRTKNDCLVPILSLSRRFTKRDLWFLHFGRLRFVIFLKLDLISWKFLGCRIFEIYEVIFQCEKNNDKGSKTLDITLKHRWE